MRKLSTVLAVVATILAVGGVARAWDTDPKDTLKTGWFDAAGGLRKDGTEITASADELNIVDGVTATAAELNAAADLSARVQTVSRTNNQAITLSASTPRVHLTPYGGTNNSTITVTLARPYPLYETFLITVASGATNNVTIADSTTILSLGSNVTMGPTDSLTIYTTATNKAVKVASSDN